MLTPHFVFVDHFALIKVLAKTILLIFLAYTGDLYRPIGLVVAQSWVPSRLLDQSRPQSFSKDAQVLLLCSPLLNLIDQVIK